MIDDGRRGESTGSGGKRNGWRQAYAAGGVGNDVRGTIDQRRLIHRKCEVLRIGAGRIRRGEDERIRSPGSSRGGSGKHTGGCGKCHPGRERTASAEYRRRKTGGTHC